MQLPELGVHVRGLVLELCIMPYFRFPQLFEFLSRHATEDNFLADDIFGEGKG